MHCYGSYKPDNAECRNCNFASYCMEAGNPVLLSDSMPSYNDGIKTIMSRSIDFRDDDEEITMSPSYSRGDLLEVISFMLSLDQRTLDYLDEFIKTAEKGFEQKLVAFNRDLWEYKMAKEEDRIEKKVVYEFNQKNQDEVSKVVELRKQKEIEKKNHEEKKAVEQAEKVVNKISDNQFRDVDVAKDSKGKEATAKERYLARKILKDRGLLQSKSQSSVKTAISKEMMQGHKNSAGR